MNGNKIIEGLSHQSGRVNSAKLYEVPMTLSSIINKAVQRLETTWSETPKEDRKYFLYPNTKSLLESSIREAVKEALEAIRLKQKQRYGSILPSDLNKVDGYNQAVKDQEDLISNFLKE